MVCTYEKGYDINVQRLCLSFVYDTQQRAHTKVGNSKYRLVNSQPRGLTVAGFANNRELVLFDR